MLNTISPNIDDQNIKGPNENLKKIALRNINQESSDMIDESLFKLAI